MSFRAFLPPLHLWLAVVFLGACGTSPVVSRLSAGPSLRGLCQVDCRTAWVSGSGATVAVSRDSGRSWRLVFPPQAQADGLDFRDLEAFSATEVVLLAAGPGEKSRIFRTSDGGISWEICAVNQAAEGFWDGIAFWDRQRGLLVGDPVDGRLTVLRTFDGGRSWSPVPVSGLPLAVEGEFAFAASGTSVAVAGKDLAWIVTGGSVARLYRTTDGGDHWVVAATPMSAGTPESGIFSLAFRDSRHGVMVGGDYEKPDQVASLAAWTDDGGLHWHAAEAMPGGYRSGVSWHARRGEWIAVGPNGADRSSDGSHWTPLQPTMPGFHAVDGPWMSGAGGITAYLR